MRKIFRTLSILMLCGAMCVPAIEAQTRGRNNGGSPQRTHAPSRSGNGGAPTRPGNNGNGHGFGQSPTRPGNNGNHHGVRPGNNGNGNHQGVRPGGNMGNQNHGVRPGNNNVRPGNNVPPGNHHGVRPGGNPPAPVRPGGVRPSPVKPAPPHYTGGVRPWRGYRPGPVPGFGHIHFGAPARPLLPPPMPYRRPVPPRYYVPFGGSLFGTILGLTVGTALNVSLNALINDGYTVSAYGNDAIYLSNVNQLNLLWPNATLYYNNGYLNASEYVYSTVYPDTNRFNAAYRMLMNNYGAPVSTQQLANGGISASWWGNNGQYVTLQYQGEMASDGVYRYYTTLSFGM